VSEYKDNFDAIGEEEDFFKGTGDGDSEDALVEAGGGTAGGSGGVATERQIAFARRIESATGVPYPKEYESSRRQTSAYIESNKAKFEQKTAEDPTLAGPGKPPSEKQLNYARKIAETLGVPLPHGCDDNWRVASKFIDDHKIAFENAGGGSGGAKPPSEKQINFARMIAEKGKLSLPAGLEDDWRIAREFIDSHKHVLDGAGGGGPRPRKK